MTALSHAKALIIPSELHQVMHEVESISRTVVRLLDAAEVGLMAEGGPAVPFLLVLDLSTPCAVVKHSTVKNRLDVGVILFVNVLRRVQVNSMGV